MRHEVLHEPHSKDGKGRSSGFRGFHREKGDIRNLAPFKSAQRVEKEFFSKKEAIQPHSEIIPRPGTESKEIIIAVTDQNLGMVIYYILAQGYTFPSQESPMGSIYEDSPPENPRETEIVDFAKTRVQEQEEQEKEAEKKKGERGWLKPVQTVVAGVVALGALWGIGKIANNQEFKLSDLLPKPGMAEKLPANFKTPEKALNNSLEIGPFGDQLEVPLELLTTQPQRVQVFIDITDQNGVIVKKLTVVNNTLWGGYADQRNSKLYESSRDPNTTKFSPYQLKSAMPMQGVGAMVNVDNGTTLFAAGEKEFRGADTTVAFSKDSGKTWTEIPWPYVVSGPTRDLLKINNTTVLGNNGNYEGGVGQYLIYLDSVQGTARVQAVQTTIQAVNLPSAGSPEITAQNPVSNTVGVLSLASQRIARGLDYSTINHQTASGTIENFFSNEWGYVYGLATYEDSIGKHVLVNDFWDGFIRGAKLDSAGRPISIEYNSDYTHWLDNKGIPNYIPGTTTIGSMWAKADTQGNVHIWVFGAYDLSDGNQPPFIGHYFKGTNPADPNAFYWTTLFPDNLNLRGAGPGKFKIVNGQPGFEFRAGGLNTFSGLGFFPINADYSPKTGAKAVYPDNGLVTWLRYQAFLPGVFKNNQGP